MPDPTLSAAIREAYASAPVDLIVYHTLEIWHPGFSDPIRVVRDRVALDARLEPGAPRNAGEIVTFAPFAFEIEPPDQTATGAPQCRVEIDNVGREIGAALEKVSASSSPKPRGERGREGREGGVCSLTLTRGCLSSWRE